MNSDCSLSPSDLTGDEHVMFIAAAYTEMDLVIISKEEGAALRRVDLMKTKLFLLVFFLMMLAVIPAAAASPVYAEDVLNTDGTHNYESNGIPIVYLDIAADEFNKVIQSEDHSYRSSGGSITIDVPEGYTGDYSAAALDDVTLDLEYIKGRGNSTWYVDKKPFKLKLAKSNDLLGMGKNKHWVLLANAFDNSMMRNRITGYIAKELGLEFTPKFEPVDFVVNGEYYGSYVLCHQIRVGSSRVNINELGPEDITEPDVTGGYLLGLSPYAIEPAGNTFKTERGVEFQFEEPLFASNDEDETLGMPEQKAYITNYLQDTEDAIFDDDQNAADHMDYDSAASYWWIQEFSKNGDAFSSPSTYLYKKREGNLFWGPVWDFDLAYDSTTSSSTGFNTSAMLWLDQMRAYDTDYQNVLRSKWSNMDAIIAELTRDGGVIDAYAAEIEDSWADNYDRWLKDTYSSDYYTPDKIPTLKKEAATLKNYLTLRRQWINENIEESLTDVFSRVTFEADGEIIGSIMIRSNSSLPEKLPFEVPEKSGHIFKGWIDEDGLEFTSFDRISGDMTLIANYIDVNDAVIAQDVFFSEPEIWVALQDEEYKIPYIVAPEDTEAELIEWKSSDVDVSDVSDDGTLEPAGTGETTITAALSNGVTRSFVLHVYDYNETPITTMDHIEFAQDEIIVNAGEYFQVPVYRSPQPSSFSPSYETSNAFIVETFEYGVMRALKPGECTITVYAETDDGEEDLTASYTLKILDNSEETAKAKDDLAALINEATSRMAAGRYTSVSFSRLQRAVDAANILIDDREAFANDIALARTRVLRALRLLTPVDQEAEEAEAKRLEAIDALAEAMIDIYENVDFSKYTPASVDALNELLKAAGELLEDEDASTSDLRSAKTDLLKARTKLVRRIDISDAVISGLSDKTYTGKAYTPAVTVRLGSEPLKEGTDYSVSYNSNRNAGTAVVTISGKGDYTGTMTGCFKIKKAANTLTAKGKAVTVKYSKVKKADKKIAASKAFSVSKNKGKLIFKKSKGSKKITVSSSGKVTAKKGLKKGTYKISVKVTAKGNSNYKPLTKKVNVYVKVK